MRILLAFALLWPSHVEVSRSHPVNDDDRLIVVRGQRCFTGLRWADDKCIFIKGGKITAVVSRSEAKIPSDARVIDLGETWVLPGLVHANTATLAPMPADRESVRPQVRAADAYDPFIPRRSLEASGITSAYLTPGSNRLVPGAGSIVRVGADPLEAIVVEQASLHAVVTPEAYNPPDIYDPSVPPGPDAGTLIKRRQFPHSRAGAFAALRSLFDKAKAVKEGRAVPAINIPGDPDVRSFVKVLEGKLGLRVRAERASDIRAVCGIAKDYGVRLVIEGGTEAWRVVPALKDAKAGVVLRVGKPPSGQQAAPAPFANQRGKPHWNAAGILLNAGVQVALVPPVTGAPGDLLWWANHALTTGTQSDLCRETDVLRAVTSTAAELLGIGATAGSIAVGRQADLCIYDRSPMQPDARPVIVLSGGKVIHDLTKRKDRPIAIHAKTIHTATGDVIKNGVVVIRNGKITAVGADAFVPAGARRVEADTVAPGFIDVGGQLGLRTVRDLGVGGTAKGTPLPASGLDKSPASLFDPTFPDVRAAAESGVTTVALTRSGGRQVSGVLSVVKTSGRDVEESVVRDVGGVLFDYSRVANTKSEIDKFRRQLQAGKKYADSWKKYDKDLAKWKKENPDQAKALPKRRVGKVKVPAPFDPLTGVWEGSLFGPEITGDGAVEVSMTLVDDKVSGTIKTEALGDDARKFEGKYENDRLTFTLKIDGAENKFEGTPLRDQLTLTWKRDDAFRAFGQVQRTSTVATHPTGEKKKDGKADTKDGKPKDGKPKDAKSKDGESKDGKSKSSDKKKGPPKAPRKVAASEPYRALLQAKIPLFIGLGDEQQARQILGILRNEFEVTTVVISPNLVPRLLDRMADLDVGFSPTGNPVRTVKGKRIVATRVAIEKEIPVAIRSGFGGDSRTLYAAASHSVRHGVRRDDALKTITRWSAMILNLHDRVGAVKAGFDADLVLIDGSLFAPGSRVRRVMIDGRFLSEGGGETR
ncbi:MAG: hypothetical protein CMJ83_19120 [Planctomycetes bacterium]|nr:hypothetical protein [Planctomycetota bacterium]